MAVGAPSSDRAGLELQVNNDDIPPYVLAQLTPTQQKSKKESTYANQVFVLESECSIYMIKHQNRFTLRGTL